MYLFSHLDQDQLPKTIWIFFFLLISQSAFSKTHPGAMEYSESVKTEITTALKEKDSAYKPRTRHLKNGQPLYTNRLMLEDSPYLLQHAHNPVNWYPWGKEAFELAQKENKPVFLSIGYATCHWCHVMEEESFENEEIAKLLNENFISIKVDREQYPDVDETYMTAVMLINGNGGWPMSSFLLPDGRPFFGGTYFPPASFTDLITRVTQKWRENHENIVSQAEELSAAVQRATSVRSAVQVLGQNVIQNAVASIVSRYDPVNGGFSQAPKFPNEPLLHLLLQAANSDQKSEALEGTLFAMAQGGIYDQIGGGFHRYSTDDRWLVPHFEKMLYNQAYLSRIYAEAWRQNGDPLHARVAHQTLDYVLREMTSKDGGFYSATDADSEGEEGTYFVWSEKEIRDVLKKEDADFIVRLYGITEQGNFEGKNILHLPQTLPEIALQENVDLPVLLDRIDRLNETLRKRREKRIPPLTDNKIIVAWNGMMITAFAEAGDIFGNDQYINAAIRAADFLWKAQRSDTGNLWRVNLDGKPSIIARQDDHANFGEALLALYDVTDDQKWLERAIVITDEMIVRFSDKNNTGAFLMGNDEILFAQPKSSHDTATPAGNSVAVRLLSRLAKRTGNLAYKDRAQSILQSLSGSIAEFPSAHSYMLAQLDELLNNEISARQFAARGAVRISASLEKVDHVYNLIVDLNIAEGWHVNSDQPVHDELIPTKISVALDDWWKLETPEYPEALMKTFEFEEQEMALYQGKILITSKLKPKARTDMGRAAFPLNVSVQIQACNKEACLAPETIKLSVTLPFSTSM